MLLADPALTCTNREASSCNPMSKAAVNVTSCMVEQDRRIFVICKKYYKDYIIRNVSTESVRNLGHTLQVTGMMVNKPEAEAIGKVLA